MHRAVLAAGGAAALAAGGCRRSEALFTPSDDVAGAIEAEVRAAEESVDVAIYTFTLRSLADALAEDALRGLRVRVLADASQSAPVEEGGAPGQAELLAGLEDAGVAVCTASGEAGGILHHKFLVVDRHTVVTGSANFTVSGTAAEEGAPANLENVLVVADARIAARYAEAFEELWSCD